MTESDWLDESRVAAELGVKVSTVRTYVSDGRMPRRDRPDGWSRATFDAWRQNRPGQGHYERPSAGDRLHGKYLIDEGSGCWIWTGHVAANGYGHWRGSDGRRGPAHRRVWEILVGDVPASLHLDHLCRVKRCVNPAHLEPVTPQENARRWAATLTHCPQGHAYDDSNTYTARGKRHCKECKRAHFRTWYHTGGGAEAQRARRQATPA